MAKEEERIEKTEHEPKEDLRFAVGVLEMVAILHTHDCLDQLQKEPLEVVLSETLEKLNRLLDGEEKGG